MVVFKRTIDLTDNERVQVSEMTGKIMLWVLERRGLDYMSSELNIPKRMVLENICETIYELFKVVGRRNYLKFIFRKRI